MNFNTFVTKSLEEKDVSFLLNFPRRFLKKQELDWVDWILEYNMEYGAPPTIKRFKKEFSLFVEIDSDDPIADVFDQTIKSKKNMFTREFLTIHADDIKNGDDPSSIIEELSRALNTGTNKIVRMSTVSRNRYYERGKTYTFGVKELDSATGGIMQGDLAYIVGRPASGKTTLTEWLTKTWWEQECRILYASNENPALHIVQKIDSMVGGWNPIKQRTGDWTGRDRNKVKMLSYVSSKSKGDVIIPSRKVQYVSELASYIATEKPDIVVIDGVYLMRDPEIRGGGWEQAASVSRQLKEVALEFNIPLVGVIQANKGAEGKNVKRENVAHTDAYLQDADIMLGITPDEGGISLVEALKNRWGPLSGFVMEIDFDDMRVIARRALYAEDKVDW